MLHNYGCEQPNFSSGLLQMFLHANGVFFANKKTKGGEETLFRKNKHLIEWKCAIIHYHLWYYFLFLLLTTISLWTNLMRKAIVAAADFWSSKDCVITNEWSNGLMDNLIRWWCAYECTSKLMVIVMKAWYIKYFQKRGIDSNLLY